MHTIRQTKSVLAVLGNGRIYTRNANGDFICLDVSKRGDQSKP